LKLGTIVEEAGIKMRNNNINKKIKNNIFFSQINVKTKISHLLFMRADPKKIFRGKCSNA
jgi:hypothetical protein